MLKKKHGKKNKVDDKQELPAKPAKEKQPEIFNQNFKDVLGVTVNAKDFLSDGDAYAKGRGERKVWILRHTAIRKLADTAGVSKNYDVDVEQPFPTPENMMSHTVRVTVNCLAKEKDGCVHDRESKIVSTGQADRLNTNMARGGKHLRHMAENRAYDRAIISHLGLVSVLSEEESAAFDDDKEPDISPEEYEMIAPLTIEIYSATSSAELMKIRTRIVASIKANPVAFTENQKAFLSQVGKETYDKLIKPFELK